MNHSLTHTPLDAIITPGTYKTGGRLKRDDQNCALTNARGDLVLVLSEELSREIGRLTDATLLLATGYWDGTYFHLHSFKPCHSPPSPTHSSNAWQEVQRRAVVERAKMNATIRQFFKHRHFIEVETPYWIDAPGTDIYLTPFEASFHDDMGHERLHGYLHTSPEFSMKRLLSQGFEKIVQLCHVWRNGEVTNLHNPEFTILEWYRAWEDVTAIMNDVEQLTRLLFNYQAPEPFLRLTMQELIQTACGFDILDALSQHSLQQQCLKHSLLPSHKVHNARWDELFFELIITYVDPLLATSGPVFITEWPAPLAVLAQKKPGDPRVAQRFELYFNGVELANGFGELTDPVEQRQRFEEDSRHRQSLGLPTLPMPETFLSALDYGLPPSSGVAMGVDRMLMLAMDVSTISAVLPFALRRDSLTNRIVWR